MFSLNLDEILEKLVDLVDGNFLVLIYVFDFWVRVGNINVFLFEMDYIYYLNVLRIFSKIENIFKDVWFVIEILCVLYGFIEEFLFYEVLSVDDLEWRKYFFCLLLNELFYFI